MIEEFEEWVTTPPVDECIEKYPESVAFPSGYKDWSVQLAFEGWQKAWEIQQEKIDKLERRKDANRV